MKYKAIEQTVQAVQITPDIEMIAPDWLAKKMNTARNYDRSCTA